MVGLFNKRHFCSGLLEESWQKQQSDLNKFVGAEMLSDFVIVHNYNDVMAFTKMGFRVCYNQIRLYAFKCQTLNVIITKLKF